MSDHALPTPAQALKQSTIIVYVLYLLNVAIPFLGIIGVIIAYSKRAEAGPGPRSHLTYQIHTFWLSLLYTVIVFLLCFLIIGLLLILPLFIWYITRVVVGLLRAVEGRPIDNPTSLFLW